MKKLTTLLIGCSLMFAAVANAQQAAEEQPTPAEKQASGKGKHAGEGKPEAAAEKAPEGGAMKERAGKNEHAEAKTQNAEHADGAKAPAGHGKHAAEAAKAPMIEATPKAEVAPKVEATPKVAASTAPMTKPELDPAMSAAPAGKQHGQHGDKHQKAPNTAASPAATTAATAAPVATPATAASATPAASASATIAATTTASATATPAATTSSSAAAITATPKPNTAAATKKPDAQRVQQIRTEHANFTAQPNLQVAPAVTFNPSYRVEGSDRWQGPQYEVYRSYRPERHDEAFYRSRYSRVELIGGGYYYQNNNYWYPAWGYNPRSEYYAYDGPIYAGHRGERADRVVADVQATLKEMGYYTGQVDGLLGPLTRKALIGYQEDAGLTATAAIDEPTLDTLNLSS